MRNELIVVKEEKYLCHFIQALLLVYLLILYHRVLEEA